MKTINKILVSLLVAVMPLTASAQILQKAAQRMELATVESEVGGVVGITIEVFKLADAGTYWLSVGNLGIGGDLIQLTFDPVYELFIPLGNSLDEAIGKMNELKGFYKKPRLSQMEVQGCLAAVTPNDNFEPVTVTSRRLLTSKILSFSVKRDDMVRATYISKADFGGLLFSLKAYKKLHPKEQ